MQFPWSASAFWPAGKGKEHGKEYVGEVYGPGLEVVVVTSLSFHWLELSYMDTLYCKGVWEI